MLSSNVITFTIIKTIILRVCIVYISGTCTLNKSSLTVLYSSVFIVIETQLYNAAITEVQMSFPDASYSNGNKKYSFQDMQY